ncbi:hypothetical protein [Anaerolinea sp.]|uniref:hypothetical protein n=1 Tax=Anaerolinea sp. TaxID=1872519 RepID=UPI002ACDA6D2|nr:hypothetical protein [Anaerolinea sp.]
MKNWRLWIGLAGLTLLLLSGCARTAQVAEPTAQPTPEVPPTAIPTPTPKVDTCLECHTDKDRLIDTAKPEEKVVSESEGAG